MPKKSSKKPVIMHEGKKLKGEVYKVPIRFYEDHIDRHNDRDEMQARIVKYSGNHVHVLLNDDQASDLHSDAEYYSHGIDMDFEGMHGLKTSAKATHRALGRQFYGEE